MIEDSTNIPLEIRPYLYEIAVRLKSGHAAVMVGSGFSKNAIKSDATKPDIPNWSQLGDILYEKIYQTPPPTNYHYLNVLKLAEEVQAAFGRPVLDHLLRTAIQDKDFEPSELHTRLLELPWCDVFTTNYDTLLERSCESVVSQKFDIVVNQEDLMYSQRPRIIKLHGSFPSERPLIVTEDDYRKYPKLFAPFVNTVQQSLLENTLCLIGFSGDDPNFLQWIGWIHDNLGKENSPKIYLIGLLHLSGAQKRLLESKNIVVVDLSMCQDVEGDPAKALTILFNFLRGEGGKDANLEWPAESYYYSNDSTDLDSLIDEWKRQRLSYPNWVILPQEQRARLWQYTQKFAMDENIFKSCPLYKDLHYTYELNWRLERCLFPIYNNIAPYFKAVLDRYNPFEKELPDFLGEHVKDAPIELNQFRNQWLEILLGLLRFYREEEWVKEWEEAEATLRHVQKHFNPEQLARYYYERTLKCIFNSDYKKATEVLESWPTSEYLPFWEAKKAGLMAEIGQVSEADKIIEKSLLSIRKHQNLSPVINDYTWVSQEAYTMLLQRIVFLNIKGKQKSEMRVQESKNSLQRWTTLTQYKCDPWGEKKYFDLYLQAPYIHPVSKKTNTSFDIGEHSVTYQLNPSDKASFTSYTFLRFVEESGIPLGIKVSNFDSKTIRGALERMNTNSWYWALSAMVRYGDEKLFDVVLDRDIVNDLKAEDADKMVVAYLDSFEELLGQKSNPLAKTKIKIGPEFLSRLSVKNSEDVKIRLYGFIQYVYNQQIRIQHMDKLLTRLINGSSWDLQYKMIPILMDVPLLDARLADAQIYFKEPSFYIKLYNYNPKIPINVKQSLINRILEEAKEDDSIRESAISRLFLLYKLKLLDESYSKELFKLIWSKKDPKSGFPEKTRFYKFAFLSLPCPDGTIPEALFKKYILEGAFEIQGSDGNNGISMGADSIFGRELLGASATIFNRTGLVWTKEELTTIWNSCELWWEADKHFLKEPEYRNDRLFGDVHEEFQSRFEQLVKVISNLFGYQKFNLKDTAVIQRIIDVIIDMDNYELPNMEAKAAFSEVFYPNVATYILELDEMMISEFHSRLIDALNSTIIISEDIVQMKNEWFINELLETICQPIKWRVKGVSEHCIDAVLSFIRYKKNINLDVPIKTLLSILRTLYRTTKMENLNQLSIDEKLIYRKKAIKVASILFNYFESRNNEVPSIVTDWQRISLDNNEFSDVSNQWTIVT